MRSRTKRYRLERFAVEVPGQSEQMRSILPRRSGAGFQANQVKGQTVSQQLDPAPATIAITICLAARSVSDTKPPPALGEIRDVGQTGSLAAIEQQRS